MLLLAHDLEERWLAIDCELQQVEGVFRGELSSFYCEVHGTDSAIATANSRDEATCDIKDLEHVLKWLLHREFDLHLLHKRIWMETNSVGLGREVLIDTCHRHDKYQDIVRRFTTEGIRDDYVVIATLAYCD